jgi:hypothetical protein
LPKAAKPAQAEAPKPVLKFRKPGKPPAVDPDPAVAPDAPPAVDPEASLAVDPEVVDPGPADAPANKGGKRKSK